MEVTLGGDRVGSGKRMKVDMHNYGRSTHDLGYIWRSTMASGTLVPFMTEIALPGDNFDINLDCDIKTHPTIGPLFGSYKVQLDVYEIPIRLYNALLHMNLLNVGNKISQIKFPQITLESSKPTPTKGFIDNQQINPSSIMSYLNIRGLGTTPDTAPDEFVQREFNAIPWLAYWDIYKNYYANKQEEIGVVIHNPLVGTLATFETVELSNVLVEDTPTVAYSLEAEDTMPTLTTVQFLEGSRVSIYLNPYIEFDLNRIEIYVSTVWHKFLSMFENIIWDEANNVITGTVKFVWWNSGGQMGQYRFNNGYINKNDVEPQLTQFPLTNIDDMRLAILTNQSKTVPFNVNSQNYEPYKLLLHKDNNDYSIQCNQEGLGIKTYQSDLFNNWVSTDWIDGENGVNEITKIITTGDSFTVDQLNLSKKLYEMLNRIAVGDGSYDAWLKATYTHDGKVTVENPIYRGGLIKELTFAEVISNAESNDQPLGTLAGRGIMANKHKGGQVHIKVDEPSYIMGIISLTPRVDYSQGNKWDTNLKTLDDLHKPALDQIGFQDLITDQMAWFDTYRNTNTYPLVYKSAGKQPAWINYMTNVNQVRGNFAEPEEQMFMVLNRRYTPVYDNEVSEIADLTTYIDPSKFNHIFAYTRRDAQNFWAQIKVDITARRKMSAKLMPNL